MLTQATALLITNLCSMRTLLVLLFFLPAVIRAQCPDPDSVLQHSIIVSPIWGPFPSPSIYIGANPPILFNWSVITVALPANGKMPLPLVNQDPPLGPKKWLKNGFCRIYYPDMQDTLLLATGRYLNGKKSGLWTWYHTNGEISCRGRYVNGLKTGLWTEYNEGHGQYETGNYAAGRKQGKWETRGSDSVLATKRFFNQGLLHGTDETYIDGRLAQQCTYAYGLNHGKCITYDNDRVSVEQNFVRGTMTSALYYNGEGKLQSKTEYFGNSRTETMYEDNQKTITHYRGDEMHGWHLVYVNGVLTTKQYYRNGNLHGYSMTLQGDEKDICYYKSGNLNGPFTRYKKTNDQWLASRKAYYVNGEQEGAYFEKSDDGSTYFAQYEKHRLKGLAYKLSPTGDTLFSAHYVDGEIHGRYLNITGQEKTIAQYRVGSKTHELKYINNEQVSEKFFRNGYEYNPKQSTQINETGQLQEEQYGADGKLKTRRIFAPEGLDRMRQSDFFPNGNINRMVFYAEHRKQEALLLNEKGDTLEYENLENWSPQGRQIRRYAVSAGHGYVVKGWFDHGSNEGYTELFYADTVEENGTQKTNLILAARGEMYKGQPFRHWELFYADGAKKYEGCLCGIASLNASQPYMPFQAQSPVNITNQYIACGNHILYYPSGRIKEKRQHNHVEVYDETGALQESGDLKNEVRQGLWRIYDKTGKEIRKDTYEDGSLVRSIAL